MGETLTIPPQEPEPVDLSGYATQEDIADLAPISALADLAPISSLASLAPKRLTINAQTGIAYTPVVGDEQQLVTLDNSAAITVTLPQDSAMALPVGGQIHFAQIGVGQPTFVAGAGATLNTTPGAKFRARYSIVTAIKRAANTWILAGDLAA